MVRSLLFPNCCHNHQPELCHLDFHEVVTINNRVWSLHSGASSRHFRFQTVVTINKRMCSLHSWASPRHFCFQTVVTINKRMCSLHSWASPCHFRFQTVVTNYKQCGLGIQGGVSSMQVAVRAGEGTGRETGPGHEAHTLVRLGYHKFQGGLVGQMLRF